MWVLLLNNMQAAQIEMLEPVACAKSKEALLAFLGREKVDGYQDGRWGKAYRQGGPLEWYNPPWHGDEYRHFQDAGHEDDWATNARRRYREQVLSLPEV